MNDADKLQQIMDTFGLTPDLFCKETHMSANYVRRILSGEAPISVRRMCDLAIKYKLSYEWLRSGTDPMFRNPDEQV